MTVVSLELDYRDRADIHEFAPVEDILLDVVKERQRQLNKWDRQPSADDHHWSSILGEEYGEAMMARNDHDFSELYVELIQTAAVAVAWAQKVRKYNEERVYD